MHSQYSGMGPRVFVDRLKTALGNRLEQFYSEIIEEYRHDPEAIQALTAEGWMEKYKKWSDRKILQKLAENYLLGDEKDT